ncbi:MAG: geranylgeranylglycerol-phosphate geranylgeranyltransferase [Bacteroidetes bacterium]|nr:geranylgeranylglycerol-phosphate geranylgeranyltransferase [Bacteroidota bacterium]
MKISAFFKLIRWKNLLIVGLTQVLAAYSFLHWPIVDILSSVKLYITIFSTLLVTAAGYIINDYLDVNIDQINKPKDVIIGNLISRKSAIKLHISITVFALLLSLLVSKWLFIIEIATTIILIKYSSTFKKQFLIGNIIVSFLCGVILPVMYLWKNLLSYKYLIIYGLFAGWITLIREIVKDIEDIKGDRMLNCKTLPIVLGVQLTKKIIYILGTGLLITSIIFYMMSSYFKIDNNHIEIIFISYIFLFVELPLVYILIKLKKAVLTKEFSHISSILKVVMLAGILSMIFFRF